jgi:hypothetical protein
MTNSVTVPELFNQVNSSLLKILALLDEERALLAEQRKKENWQLRQELEMGWMKYKGILVPKADYEHRILFDSYGYHLVDSFLRLFKGIYAERDSISTEYAFRSLVEISYYRIQILFSNEIKDDEKEKYKYFIWLADYASLGINHPEHKRSYINLLSEFEKVVDLNKEGYRPFVEMKRVLEQMDKNKHADLVIKIRKKILDVQNDIRTRSSEVKLPVTVKVKEIYSELSHMLHGNTLFVHHLFTNDNRPSQHKLRAHWFLLISGLNAVTCVSNYLGNQAIKDKVDSVHEESRVPMLLISKHWQQIEEVK